MKAAEALEHLPDAIARRWRRRSSDTLPHTLTQGRIYVLPTRAGLAFATALLVMLLGAINYGLSLGYALVFLLFGLGIAGTVHAVRNLLGVSINGLRADPVFAGETTRLRLMLENRSQHRRASLHVRHDEADTRVDLDPGEAIEAEVPLQTLRRGWQTIGRVSIWTTWPLGLARAWSVLRPKVDHLVYPAPEKYPPPLPFGNSAQSRPGARRHGDDDFSGLRPHRITDAPGHVAWKAAAGDRPLMTKEFSSPEGVILRLDWHTLPPVLDDDARAERLAAWAMAAEARGLQYGLRTPEGELAAACGSQHLNACLARLAVARSRDDAR